MMLCSVWRQCTEVCQELSSICFEYLVQYRVEYSLHKVVSFSFRLSNVFEASEEASKAVREELMSEVGKGLVFSSSSRSLYTSLSSCATHDGCIRSAGFAGGGPYIGKADWAFALAFTGLYWLPPTSCQDMPE